MNNAALSEQATTPHLAVITPPSTPSNVGIYVPHLVLKPVVWIG